MSYINRIFVTSIHLSTLTFLSGCGNIDGNRKKNQLSLKTRKCMSKNGFKIEEAKARKKSPFLQAVKSGDIDAVKNILDKGEFKGNQIEDAINIATGQSNKDLLNLLLNAENKIQQDIKFRNPLIIAVNKNDIITLKFLIDKGNYEQYDIRGACEFSIDNNNLEAFEFLLKSIKDKNGNILYSLVETCVQKDKGDFLKLVLERGRRILLRRLILMRIRNSGYGGHKEMIKIINEEITLKDRFFQLFR